MLIDISHYQLLPVGGSYRLKRHGALVRLTTVDGSVGYGDCHPWHELGDLELKKQLELLAIGKLTPLTTRTLEAAHLDAAARKSKRHLFSALPLPSPRPRKNRGQACDLQFEMPLSNVQRGAQITNHKPDPYFFSASPPSHHHLAELSSSQDQRIEPFLEETPCVFKIKVGIVPKGELAVLRQWGPLLSRVNGRLRLDFNSRLTISGFKDYLQALGTVKDCIDFYEDPFAYDPLQWQQIREEYGIALACDQKSLDALGHPNSCDTLVVKPAVQDVKNFLGDQRAGRQLVITSYLDHPIGQLTAAYAAAMVARDDPQALGLCGLLTHKAYESTPFSGRLSVTNGCLIPSLEGLGWGYDDLLEELPWQQLVR